MFCYKKLLEPQEESKPETNWIRF